MSEVEKLLITSVIKIYSKNKKPQKFKKSKQNSYEIKKVPIN